MLSVWSDMLPAGHMEQTTEEYMRSRELFTIPEDVVISIGCSRLTALVVSEILCFEPLAEETVGRRRLPVQTNHAPQVAEQQPEIHSCGWNGNVLTRDVLISDQRMP